MKTRILQTRYWDDDFVVESRKLTKYLYIYLLTCQYINISGTFQLHDKKILVETDLTPSELANAKKELSLKGKVFFKDGWVHVVNARKNNRYEKSPDNVKACQKELDIVPKAIQEFFYSSVNSTVGVLPTVTINNKSEIINHKKEESVRETKTLTAEDVKDISDSLKVKEKEVWWVYDKIKDYCESNGKTYKNYKAALRNWVRTEIERGKITPRREAPIDTHVQLPDDQRIKNFERLRSIKNDVLREK